MVRLIQRIATIVILVEDTRQESLIRRFLQRLGHDNRNIRINRAPKGSGSGEQHVREQYASEVRALRQRVTRTRSVLIACIDADTRDVQDRRAQFSRALRDADEAERQDDEPVLNLVPRRNVETWILCLNNNSVDEISDYRHDDPVTAQAIKDAALALFNWTRPNVDLPDSCVASLRESLPEFLRLPE